jgi:hypothetical protein
LEQSPSVLFATNRNSSAPGVQLNETENIFFMALAILLLVFLLVIVLILVFIVPPQRWRMFKGEKER